MYLSICIPTYNRQTAVSSQIAFLLNELKEFDSVEIIVSDNASTDDTFCALKKLESKNFCYYRHEENIGILGNIKRLFNYSRGKYVWFLGDDDVLFPGVVKAVLNEIISDPDIIFLNHSIENISSGILDSPNLFDELEIFSINSFFKNISSKRFGQLMFMSASIHKKERLSEVVFYADNVAAPLDFALNGLQSRRVALIKDVFLKNIVGNESWTAEAILVFGKYVPSIMLKYVMRGFFSGFNIALFFAWFRIYWRHCIFSMLPFSVGLFLKRATLVICSKKK